MSVEQGGLDLLEHPTSKELLQSTIPARLAYVWMDGTPRVVPIWFHWNGREFVLGTPPKAPKLKALAKNPKVALQCAHGVRQWDCSRICPGCGAIFWSATGQGMGRATFIHDRRHGARDYHPGVGWAPRFSNPVPQRAALVNQRFERWKAAFWLNSAC